MVSQVAQMPLSAETLPSLPCTCWQREFGPWDMWVFWVVRSPAGCMNRGRRVSSFCGECPLDIEKKEKKTQDPWQDRNKTQHRAEKEKRKEGKINKQGKGKKEMRQRGCTFSQICGNGWQSAQYWNGKHRGYNESSRKPCYFDMLPSYSMLGFLLFYSVPFCATLLLPVTPSPPEPNLAPQK